MNEEKLQSNNNIEPSAEDGSTQNESSIDHRVNDFSPKIKTIQELAREFNLKTDPEELQDDPHFWFLILLIFDSRREATLKILEEYEVPQLVGDLTIIEKMSQKIALESAMEIIRAGDIDKLTKAWTRASLYERIEFFQKMAKNKATDSNYILLLYFLDIDHFKRINDTYGHAAGDKVLIKLVEIINEYIRPEDAAFRYGGEEFCVLQFINRHNLEKKAGEKGISVQDLIKQISEDFRLSVIKELNFITKNGKTENLTISQGTILIDVDEEGEQAVKRADQLMYIAKKTGRDKNQTQWDRISPQTQIMLKLKRVFNGSGDK
ncbi:GGDEF domain-containing protein [Patescibacteria group bacterium]|nr:GGDEF domain-containing protein [Patescibacteria group bacterium]MBU1886002.1 GGDEF domain-containing protein [Patescibacteria group bacterium]